MNQACVFCLSQDRYLFPVHKSLYNTVCPSFKEETVEFINHLQTEKILKLCWECQAKVMNFKKLIQTAQKCLHTLKMFLEFPTRDHARSESRLHVTTAEIIDIAPVAVMETPELLEDPPKLEQDFEDIKFIVEPLGPEMQTNINLDVIKIEDALDCDSSKQDNNTCLNDDSDDDDQPLILKATALSPLKNKVSVKKTKNTKKKQICKGKLKKKKPTPPPPLKYTQVWASTEVATRWYREELRREQEDQLSFVHECEACERVFGEEDQLKRHVHVTHSEEAGQYACDMCLYRFPDQTKLQQHMEAHYISYKCKECSFESRLLVEMQNHVKDTHTVIAPDINEMIACKRCKNEFASEAELKTHILSCKTYKCVDCDETFFVGRAYHQHRQKHRLDPDGIYCEVCKIYYKATWYKKHLLTSLKHVSRDSFKYECEICHLKFPLSSRLKQHLFGFHKRPGPFPCELCPKSYFNKFRLVRHCASVHKIGTVSEKEKNKMCEICGRGFTSNHVLANHMRTHSGERPWRCAECPASFAHHGSWYTHMKRTHGNTIDRYGTVTRAEKVCCEACGKEFSAKCKLKIHYDYFHLKKTKFQCETCDKYCRTAVDLKKHRNLHAVTGPLPCDTCGKTFKTRGAHTRHMKKHGLASVDGPFKCRSCDAEYSVRTNLYQHYKVKHLKLKRNDRITIKNLFNPDKEIVVLPSKRLFENS